MAHSGETGFRTLEGSSNQSLINKSNQLTGSFSSINSNGTANLAVSSQPYSTSATSSRIQLPHMYFTAPKSSIASKSRLKERSFHHPTNYHLSSRKAMASLHSRIQPIKVSQDIRSHIIGDPNDLQHKIDSSGPPGGFTEEDIKLVNQLPSNCTLADLLSRLVHEPSTSLILAFVFTRVLNDEIMGKRDGFGLTPAMICASRNWFNTLQWILDLNIHAELANEDSTALHIGVYYCYPDVVSGILEDLRDSNRSFDLERQVCFTDGPMRVYRTALQLAVQQYQPTEDHKRIIQLLVNAGCSVFLEMEGQFDSLSVAALSPHISDILPILLTSKIFTTSLAIDNIRNKKYGISENVHLTLTEMIQYNYYLHGKFEKQRELLQIIASLIQMNYHL